MSAMSASSPPAGLMPLSLISEHKSSVPPSVQPLPRTEKCAVVAASPQAVKPAVANGMESSATVPIPMVVPQIPESPHPAAPLETPQTLPTTPPTHQPNLPCGGKAESSNNFLPECPNSTNENTLNRGEDSVSEAPVHEISSQLPVSATVTVPPTPVIPSPELTEGCEEENVAEAATAVHEGTAAAVEPPKETPQVPLLQAYSSPEKPPHIPPPPSEPQVPTPTIPAEVPIPVAEPALPVSQPPAVTGPNIVPTVAVPASAPTILSPPQVSAQPEHKVVEVSKEPKVTPTARPKRIKVSSEVPQSTHKVKTAELKESSTPNKDDDKKPKRKRLPTQPYQSPIPELNIIAKINKIGKTPSRAQEEKLIVFYRNEFLAVRNAEGGFYICQAVQNIYRSSSKIKIRWLSNTQESNDSDKFYTPDFYDQTDFDCILTNLSMERVGKDKFRLPDDEEHRTQSILKRAIDIEKGVAVAEETALTEEHPDGLDLSLYRNEDQLKKKGKKLSKILSDNAATSNRTSKLNRRTTKKKPKLTKAEVVKKIAGRALLASKRKAANATAQSTAPSAPLPIQSKKLINKKVPLPLPAASAKKELPLPKKEIKPLVTKRKAPSNTVPANSPAPAVIPEKKTRREFITKKKSGPPIVGGAANKGSTINSSNSSATMGSATGTTRRNLRNSK